MFHKLSNLWRVIWLVKIFRVSCQPQNLRSAILTWFVVIHMGIMGGEASMDGGQTKRKQNKVLCLQKSPQKNKTSVNSLNKTCIFLMTTTQKEPGT